MPAVWPVKIPFRSACYRLSREGPDEASEPCQEVRR